MTTAHLRRAAPLATLAVMVLLAGIVPSGTQAPLQTQPFLPLAGESLDDQRPDFARMLRQQADTDRIWRDASVGFMQMEKILYRSEIDDLEIPAFVFQPLRPRGPRAHAALVWVHENIRGHFYEHYIPYVRDAT